MPERTTNDNNRPAVTTALPADTDLEGKRTLAFYPAGHPNNVTPPPCSPVVTATSDASRGSSGSAAEAAPDLTPDPDATATESLPDANNTRKLTQHQAQAAARQRDMMENQSKQTTEGATKTGETPLRRPTGGGAKAWGRRGRRNTAPVRTFTDKEKSIRLQEKAELTEVCPAAALVLRQDTKDREIEASKLFKESLQEANGDSTTTKVPGKATRRFTEREINARLQETAELTELCPAATLVLRQDTKDRAIEANKQFKESLQGDNNNAAEAPVTKAANRRSSFEHSQTSDIMKRAGQGRHPRQNRNKPTVSNDNAAASAASSLSQPEIIRIQERAQITKLCPAVTMVLRQDTKDRELEQKQQFLESLNGDSSVGSDISSEDRHHQTTAEEDQKKASIEDAESSILKSAARRPQADSTAELLASATDGMQFFPHTGNEEDAMTDENRYSRNSKKRVSGLIQPGAYGAAPGERPCRMQSLQFSAISNPSPGMSVDGNDSHDDDEFEVADRDMNNLLPPEHSSETQAQARLGPPPTDEEAPPISIPISEYRPSQEEEVQPIIDRPAREISARNMGLVEARQVLSDQRVIMEADEVDLQAEEDKHTRRKIQMASALGYLFVFVLGVVLGVTGTLLGLYLGNVLPKDKTEVVTPSDMQSTTPTEAPTPYLFSLPEYTTKAIESDPNSPQSLAYLWMQEDLFLESYNEDRILQRFALVTFYYATNGVDWFVQENWLVHQNHECSWHSKATESSGGCDDDDNYLSLLMTNNGLSGSLPPQLGLLTTLKYLNVATNEIGGSIPSEIGLASSLVDLTVDVNQLSGQMPTEVGLLAELRTLLVHSNSFTGTIPTEMGLLTHLELLQWANTQTGGSIPSELGQLTNITDSLHLNRNQLTGTIPSEIFLMTSLTELFALERNAITGTLPSQVGLLSSSRGVVLWSNALTGTIPTEIGQLSSANVLLIDHNQFEGRVPNEIAQLSELEWTNFCCNALTAALPSELGLLTKLTWLEFQKNQMSSTIPVEVFQKLKLLEGFIMNNNQFTGTIPSEVGLFTNLWYMTVDGNQLTGNLPSEVGQIPLIEELWVNNNSLTGKIPSELGNMTSMLSLKLGDTDFSGQIPEELGNLGATLKAIEVQNTLLSGTIPSDLCAVPVLNMTCSDILCGCDCECINISVSMANPGVPSTVSANKTQMP